MAFPFFKPINSSAFGKTIENMQKHRIINFVTNNKKNMIWSLNLISIQENN